jgi:hypothetical protein
MPHTLAWLRVWLPVWPHTDAPVWLLAGLPPVMAALVFAVWKIWRVQIRIWLIPAAELRACAAGLGAAHGAKAEAVALDLSLKAWLEHDAYAALRWERVARRLRRKGRTHRGGTHVE